MTINVWINKSEQKRKDINEKYVENFTYMMIDETWSFAKKTIIKISSEVSAKRRMWKDQKSKKKINRKDRHEKVHKRKIETKRFHLKRIDTKEIHMKKINTKRKSRYQKKIDRKR